MTTHDIKRKRLREGGRERETERARERELTRKRERETEKVLVLSDDTQVLFPFLFFFDV